MIYVIARKNKDGSVQCKIFPSGRVFIFDRDNSRKPNYRSRWVTINCFKHPIMWDERKVNS